jgi:hypothetical protein
MRPGRTRAFTARFAFWLELAGALEAGDEKVTPLIVTTSAVSSASCAGRFLLIVITVLDCRQIQPLLQTPKVMTT